MINHQAHARHGDPETSHEAAEKVSKVTAKHAMIVLRFASGVGSFSDDFMTDVLIARDPALTASSLRSRRATLVKNGLIEKAGETTNDRNNRVTLWRITDKGREALS